MDKMTSEKVDELSKRASELTRRDFLRYSGVGAAALTLAAQLEGLRPVGAAPLIAAGTYPPGGGKLQLPFWSDAGNWNLPLYYETIQAGTRRVPHMAQGSDINGDGQDELLARGPNGILTNIYDAASGQWIPLGGPLPDFSDTEGWTQPQYYLTLQTGRLVGSASQALLGRGVGGVFAFASNASGQWVPFPNALIPWSDNNHWNQPQYYETIQCCSVDALNGRNVIGRAPDGDPNGSGIQVWGFNGSLADPKAAAFTKLPPGPQWTDAIGWNQAPFYQTIQCARVHVNGPWQFQEIVGQGPNGMEVWYFDLDSTSPTYNTWVQSANIWDTNGNFLNVGNYLTIQFADLDGDGTEECIVRGPGGIQAWKFQGTLANASWVALPNGPAWTDANGWTGLQYSATIQCADIDGDGQCELLGRAPDGDPSGGGIQVWKFVPGAGYPTNPVGTWVKMPGIQTWTDANGWNTVENYSTIQTAVVKTPVVGLPHPQSVIVGRGPLGMQTWYYDPVAKNWQQTSAPYPAFTPTQQTAYVQLDTALRQGQANGNIRSIYNDETADFSDWMQRMYATPPADYNTPIGQRPATILPLPATNPPSLTDWDAVTWQVYWEMSYIGTPDSSINDYYGNKIDGLIKTTFQAQNFSLTTVGEKLSISDDSSASIAFSILALLAEAAAAIAGFPEISAAAAASISTLLSAAFSAAAEFLPNGGAGFQQAYSQLQATLSNSFGVTLAANANNQFAITGGTDGGGNYVPGDWGLMSAVGPLIQNGVWDWPSSTDGMVSALQRSYAITASKALLPAVPWIIWTSDANDGPDDYPSEYLFYSSNNSQCASGFRCVSWFSTSSVFGGVGWYPSTASMGFIFNESVPDQWFPLSTVVSDVFTGANGWPQLSGCICSAAARTVRPRIAAGVDIRSQVKLSRDPATGEILAELTMLNRGWTGANNVEITLAKLKDKNPLGGIPNRHTRIAHGKTKTYVMRFPNLPAGQRVILRVAGRYLGGNFGGSYRLTIP